MKTDGVFDLKVLKKPQVIGRKYFCFFEKNTLVYTSAELPCVFLLLQSKQGIFYFLAFLPKNSSAKPRA